MACMTVGESRAGKGSIHSQQPKNLVTSSQRETVRKVRCWVSTGMWKMVTSITLRASQHLIGQQCNRDYNRNQKTRRKAEGMLTKWRILASLGVRKRKAFFDKRFTCRTLSRVRADVPIMRNALPVRRTIMAPAIYTRQRGDVVRFLIWMRW